MRIERTHDMQVVSRILSDPAIYPHIHDDGVENYEPIDHEGFFWLSVVEDDGEVVGVFLLHAHNSSCYEMHTCLLPKIWGAQARAAGKLLGDFAFFAMGVRKLITNVPAYNRRALRFAKACGMKEEGVNRESYLHDGVLQDQTMLGITLNDWIESCQQPQQ